MRLEPKPHAAMPKPQRLRRALVSPSKIKKEKAMAESRAPPLNLHGALAIQAGGTRKPMERVIPSGMPKGKGGRLPASARNYRRGNPASEQAAMSGAEAA